MAFRRNDARRRRLAIDPVVPVGVAACGDFGCESPESDRLGSTPSRHYSFGANRRCQPKTTDLIPKRICSYLLVVLSLLAALWLITFLARQSSQWSAYLDESGTRLLAIRGQGSLASWFSSFLLIITGVASLQIYALRKHRCDDYRGAYRLWGWMAAILIIASINCVSDLTGVLAGLTSRMFIGESSNRAWMPFALKLVALSVLIVRGVYEVRASLGSLVLVLFVWVAYVAAVVLQYPVVNEALADLGPNTMLGNCLLFGTTGLFLAHITYARYVFLDAHGLIRSRGKSKRVSTEGASGKFSSDALASLSAPVPVVKSKQRTEEKVQEPKAENKRNNQPIQTPAHPTKKANSVSGGNKSPTEILKEMAAASRAKEKRQLEEFQVSESSQSTEVPEKLDSIKMSKSQRRKLRKLKKQQRRAA